MRQAKQQLRELKSEIVVEICRVLQQGCEDERKLFEVNMSEFKY